MHTPAYTLNTLFAQLGLEHTDVAIDSFIREHGPIAAAIPIHEAPCWNASQKILLQEAIAADSDWAEVVDQLDALLHKDAQSG